MWNSEEELEGAVATECWFFVGAERRPGGRRIREMRERCGSRMMDLGNAGNEGLVENFPRWGAERGG